MKHKGRSRLQWPALSLLARASQELIRDIENYEKAPNSFDHEHLLRNIQMLYRDQNVAEFFDQEGCLPLATAAPYPMKQHESLAFQSWLEWIWLLATCGLLAVATFWLHGTVSLIAAASVSAALILIIPAIADVIWRRRLPDDIQERLRLVNVFEELRRTEVWRNERRAKEAAANRRVSRAAQARRKFKRTHKRVTPASILLRRRVTTK